MADEVHSCLFLGKEECRRNEGSHNIAHWKSRWRVFSFQRIPLPHVGASQANWTDGRAVLGPLSPVLKAGLKKCWEQSLSYCLSPAPPLWTGDVYTPFPCRSGPRGLRGRASAEAPREEKSLQDGSALPCPEPPNSKNVPTAVILPEVKKGREKLDWPWGP